MMVFRLKENNDVQLRVLWCGTTPLWIRRNKTLRNGKSRKTLLEKKIRWRVQVSVLFISFTLSHEVAKVLSLRSLLKARVWHHHWLAFRLLALYQTVIEVMQVWLVVDGCSPLAKKRKSSELDFDIDIVRGGMVGILGRLVPEMETWRLSLARGARGFRQICGTRALFRLLWWW